MRPLHLIPAVSSLVLIAACKTPAGPPEKNPYPVVNVVPYYEMEASWINRPSDLPWADMPGVAIDKDENIWCSTRTRPAIQVYSPSGNLMKSWETESNSTAHQIKIDTNGNIWLADIGLHLVRKFTPDGKELMHIGTPGEAGKGKIHLNKSTDMAITSNGEIFISDGYGNARIVHCDKDGKFIKSWATLGNTDDRFSIPHAIAIDSRDNIYVADCNNVRVQVYNTDGKLQQMWAIPKATDGKEKPGEFNWVHCLALDKYGNIYSGDIIGQRMQKFIRKNE